MRLHPFISEPPIIQEGAFRLGAIDPGSSPGRANDLILTDLGCQNGGIAIHGKACASAALPPSLDVTVVISEFFVLQDHGETIRTIQIL